MKQSYRIDFYTGEIVAHQGSRGYYSDHEQAREAAFHYFDQKIKILSRELEVYQECRKTAEEST